MLTTLRPDEKVPSGLGTFKIDPRALEELGSMLYELRRAGVNGL
jgi:hypothetical protein